MKTSNVNQPGERAHGIARGHTGKGRAGTPGMTFRDASTEADPIWDLLVVGGTITDNDDGTAILSFLNGVIVGELTPTGSRTTITSGSDYVAFPGVTWLDEGPHAVGHRLLLVYRHGTTHTTGGYVAGRIGTVTDIDTWAISWASEFTIEDVANSVGGTDNVSVIDDVLYVTATEYDGSANVDPHILVCDYPASTMTSSSTWTRYDVALSEGTTQNLVVGRVRRLINGEYLCSAYWQDGSDYETGLVKVSDPTDWSSPTVVLIAAAYNENDIEEMADGTLIAHLRNAAQTYHYTSTSTDAGATWSTPVQLYAAMGLPTWRRLISGIGLTVYRSADGSLDTAWRQTPSAVTDTGWGSETILDSGGGHPVGESEYATILQLDNTHVLVVYAYDAGGAAPPSNIYSRVFTDSSLFSSSGTVRVSATDAVAGLLQEKLVAGTDITLTKEGAGGSESLRISSTAVSGTNLEALGVRGEILVSDAPAGSPLVFSDLLQNETGTELLYADL